jgi:hypothetical protein
MKKLFRLKQRSGMALPASMAAITAVSVLISGIWVIVDLNAKTSANRRSAVNALLVAEAGQSHGIALLRGALRTKNFTKLLLGEDSVANNSNDGRFIGYGLNSTDEIPAAGKAFAGGTYTAVMEDDPNDSDGDPLRDANNSILLRCRGVMPDGASAEIIAIISMVPLPAMATEGRLNIGGNPQVSGACGGLHANQVVQATGASVLVDGPVTASDTVRADPCQIRRLDGTCNTPLNNQPPVDIPQLTVAEVCPANPTYRLDDMGNIRDGTTGALLPAATGGWQWTSSNGGRWYNNAANPTNGVICATEDIEIAGSPGDEGNPWRVSLYTTKAVKMSGSPVMEAYDPNGGLIIAEGDVSIAGTPGAGFNYGGMIYAGAQCELRGNARINGQVLCKDNADPAGSINYVNTGDVVGDVSGSPQITFNCSGSVLSKRRISSWVQKLGS